MEGVIRVIVPPEGKKREGRMDSLRTQILDNRENDRGMEKVRRTIEERQ